MDTLTVALFVALILADHIWTCEEGDVFTTQVVNGTKPNIKTALAAVLALAVR